MTQRTRSFLLPVAGLALGALVAACAGESAVSGIAAPARRAAVGVDAPRLVECPLPLDAPEVAAPVDTSGGTLSIGRQRLRVPRGAVATAVLLTMDVPASRYVELELHARGHASYRFRQPVTVTLDYSRCAPDAFDPATLRAVYIDPVTKAVLEDMGGVVDPVARTITFETDHFSTYAVAD